VHDTFVAALANLVEEPALDTYRPLPSVRGDLLDKLGRPGEARAEFERAAQRTANSRQRAALLERAAACASRVDAACPRVVARRESRGP
jgi:predicted RNA polymerase sigma factor